MANSGKKNQNEMDIPEPINRPKEEEKVRADHPNEEQNQDSQQPKKIGRPAGSNNTTTTSRFEPAPLPVEIPSRGYLYKGLVDDQEVAKGVVRIRPMTFKEEKILTDERLVNEGRALDLVLENCIKSDVDPLELLSVDRMYILFYLRGMSYDLTYEFDVRCYHCGENFVQTVQIDKLPIKTWETKEQAEEPVVLKLPNSGATLEAHYMRGKEENAATEEAEKARGYDEPDALGSAILYTVDKVTLSDGEVLSPRDKNDFLNNLIASDMDYFRETMNDYSPGIKQLKNIRCPNCRGKLEFNVPLGRNFFRRSRQRTES